MSEIVNAIQQRVSSPKLGAPKPSPEQIEQALKCAVQAPDHGRLKPWRFIVVEGDGLVELGHLFVRAKQAVANDLTEAQIKKLEAMPLRAPLVIICVAQVQPQHKVSVTDQILAVGAAVQNMQLVFRDQGFGVMWRTGEMAELPTVKQMLGLKPEDVIVSYLYVGAKAEPDREPAKNKLEDCVSYWNEGSFPGI